MNSWLIACIVMSSCAALMSVASIILFGKLKAAFGGLACRAVYHDELSETTEPLEAQLSSLAVRLDRLEEEGARRTEWAGQAEALNLSRRGQVLRMHRRGESALDIASALHMRHGDVTLMIKVFEIAKGPQESGDEFVIEG